MSSSAMKKQQNESYQIPVMEFNSNEKGTETGKLIGRGKLGTVIPVAALVFYGQSIAICCSIRYGFLVDSFTSRGVSGKVNGFVESSLFIGYAGVFLVGWTERFMKRFGSCTLLTCLMLIYFFLQVASGLVYLLQSNTAFVTLSFVLRILQGIFAYPCYLIPLDFINANFKGKFDLVNGLLNMGYFSGHGIAEMAGSILYDHFGYTWAFIFSAIVAVTCAVVIFLVIPNTPTYLSTQRKESEEDDMDTTNKKIGLTKLLIIPMMATMCINANYGVLQVTVTPFLKEEFHKSISYGGSVLTLVSLGMATGGFSAGIILQKRILHQFSVMALGALCVCTGLLLTFPPPSVPALHNLTPITVFPGVFLAGLGDPLITIATLRALYDIQLKVKGVMTPKIVTKITSIWLVGYCTLYYFGPFIAGFLTDYLSYSTTAEILAGFCLVAMMTCLALRVFFNEKVDEEKIPILVH